MFNAKIIAIFLYFIVSANAFAKGEPDCGIENPGFERTLLQARGVYLGKVKAGFWNTFIIVEKSWKVDELKKIKIKEPSLWSRFDLVFGDNPITLSKYDGIEIIIAHADTSLNPLDLNERCNVVYVLLEDSFTSNMYKKMLTQVLGEPKYDSNK